MQTVEVDLPKNGYTIIAGSGLFKDTLPIRHLADAASGRSCLIVTDSNVGPLYERPLTEALRQAGAASISVATIAAGESSKTLSTMESLYEHALDAGLNRTSVVLGLGGGVVGDLAGFLAATYMRGIACVQVPTSLLAMVDSSVGGKTGVDLPRGKNLVGAFHQPSLVLADVSCLSTLPARELACGLAEVAKYAFIMAPEFHQELSERAEALNRLEPSAVESIVRQCCELKTKIVIEDERERGRRALLNYGHTFGHALESRGGYAAYRHGEAVAIGMGMAADLSVRLSLASPDLPRQQDELLKRLHLPIRWQLADTNASAIIEIMRSDKKMRSAALRLVLCRKIGQAVVEDVTDETAVAQAIEGRREPA
ncbi:MAG: 3-dehydroquinate synthase [Verrucomicrobiota bacterium]